MDLINREQKLTTSNGVEFKDKGKELFDIHVCFKIPSFGSDNMLIHLSVTYLQRGITTFHQ